MGPRGLSGDSGIDCAGPRGQSSVVFVYSILESLSLAVSKISCSISISDMVVTSYYLSLGLPTLLCPAHIMFPLGCMGIFFISSSSGAL